MELVPKTEALSAIDRAFPHWKRLLSGEVYNHSENVCNLSLILCERFGFDLNTKIEVAMGALLHDIGKSQVNQDILDKVEKLTTDDRLLIECHPQLGHQLLRKLCLPKIVIDIAHYHHEKLDGSGYPDALDARKIDIRTQIVTVADMYDAMATDRSYRPAMKNDEIFKILEEDNRLKINQTAVKILKSHIYEK